MGLVRRLNRVSTGEDKLWLYNYFHIEKRSEAPQINKPPLCCRRLSDFFFFCLVTCEKTRQQTLKQTLPAKSSIDLFIKSPTCMH